MLYYRQWQSKVEEEDCIVILAPAADAIGAKADDDADDNDDVDKKVDWYEIQSNFRRSAKQLLSKSNFTAMLKIHCQANAGHCPF